MKNISRRTAIKTVLAGSAAMAVSGMAVIRWMNFVRFVKT